MIEEDGTFRGFQKACDRLEKRGLPCTISAYNESDFSFQDVQVNRMQDLGMTIVDVDPLETQEHITSSLPQ
jgi:hypothetical protein